MLLLYYAPGSSSMATHIALHEVGAPFERRLVSFANREQQTPAYLGVNPEGKVPALVVDGWVLTEVAATLYYLAKTYPEAGLWPSGGIEEEAHAVSWMSFIAATVHPARRAGNSRWREVFHLCEQRLDGEEWAAGGHYSIADIHLFRLFWRFVDALGPDRAAYPSLMAHYDRMMAREVVKKTIAIESAIGYEFPLGAGTSQMRAVLSPDPVRSVLPSGVKATLKTPCVCPSNTAIGANRAAAFGTRGCVSPKPTDSAWCASPWKPLDSR